MVMAIAILSDFFLTRGNSQLGYGAKIGPACNFSTRWETPMTIYIYIHTNIYIYIAQYIYIYYYVYIYIYPDTVKPGTAPPSTVCNTDPGLNQPNLGQHQV